LKRQSLRIITDLSSGLNLYPTLRLTDNVHEDYVASLAAISDVMAKMEILGARDLVLSLHRHPENNFTGEQTGASFATALKSLASEAASHGITLYLRVDRTKQPRSLAEGLDWLDRVGTANLKLAVNPGLLAGNSPAGEVANRFKDKLGLWLVAGSQKDGAGKIWDSHAPIQSGTDWKALANTLAVAPAALLLLDAIYAGPDEEYLDATNLERALERVSAKR
jgi:sugar phosphate isomerase/epimerase